MKYAIHDTQGLFVQFCDDATVDTLPPSAVELTADEWENRHYIRKDILTGKIVPYIPPGPDPTIAVAQKISTLWQAAHDYEYQRISGAAFALLTLGVLQGKPKCIAIQGWISSIWMLYYQRKALITVDSVDNLDFSICGPMPHSIPELMQEVGG